MSKLVQQYSMLSGQNLSNIYSPLWIMLKLAHHFSLLPGQKFSNIYASQGVKLKHACHFSLPRGQKFSNIYPFSKNQNFRSWPAFGWPRIRIITQWDALLVKSRQIGQSFERLISLLESKSKGCVIPIFYLMNFKMEITTFVLYEILSQWNCRTRWAFAHTV